MDENYKNFKNQLPSHLDDPEWLSKAAIELTTILYTQSAEMANAEFEESAAAVGYMSAESDGGKKMSVAESEKRAVVDTNNGYSKAKLSREAVVETINAIKKRIDVLSWEHKN